MGNTCCNQNNESSDTEKADLISSNKGLDPIKTP